MEKLCARVRAEDASALEALVKPVRDRSSVAVQDFLQLHSSRVSQPPSPTAYQPTSSASGSSHSDDDAEEEPVSGRQTQLHLPEIPADESAAESWENLEEVCMSDQSLYVILVTEALSLFIDLRLQSRDAALSFFYKVYMTSCSSFLRAWSQSVNLFLFFFKSLLLA